MRFEQAIRRFAAYMWHGPPTLAAPLHLEWRLILGRWLGVVVVSPALPFTHLSPARLLAAYLLVGMGALFNLSIQVLIHRQSALVSKGYLPVVGDSLLIWAMIGIGGGFTASFYFLLFAVTVQAAMRYGYAVSLAVVTLFIGLNILQAGLAGHALDSAFFTRSISLVLANLLAGYLREQAHRAETALRQRLRQTALLDDTTAALGASLEVETVFHAIAAAACRLFGGTCAVMQSTPAEDAPDGASVYIVHPAAAPALAAQHESLAALCHHHAGLQSAPEGNPPAWQRTALPCGRQALVLPLWPSTRRLPLAILAVSMPYGEPLPAIAPDILDAFVARATLAVENASLYRTLTNRTADLQRAYGDLAAAHQELLGVDEMKTAFLANVSHELRTPLTSLRAYSELLLTYVDTPAMQREFLDIINAESERLTCLVNDVLDLTKMEAGQMQWDMARVDLAALLHDAACTHAPLIAASGLTLALDVGDELPPVYADRARLLQVVGNLLTNAVKFTAAGTITLSATRTGTDVHVEVADTGVGIAAEDHERIFEKFQQVGDTLTGKPRGAGLGLCICREIVASHQGTLRVESRVGAGSTFTLSLPMDVSAIRSSESPPRAA